MEKILYVTTVVETINAFLIPHIEMLIEMGYEVDVATNVNVEIAEELKDLNVDVYNVSFNRNPGSLDNVKAYKELQEVILAEEYSCVHTHTPIASAIARMVCRNNDVKVIYTAHGFHFYEGAPLLNWLLYYPVEKYLSRHTDTLITINQEDYGRAKSYFQTDVVYIPGIGLDTTEISTMEISKLKKRHDLKIPADSFLLLSVGELNKNKNHALVIRALAKLNDPNIHYAICGKGPLKEELQHLSRQLAIEQQVHFLGTRKDVPEILLTSDLFVFPSYREGLSVAMMEAMASGLPIVASNIRGNSDLINEEGGYLIEPNDLSGFSEAILKMYQQPKETKIRMGNVNKNQVEKYDIDNVIKEMEELYLAS